MPEYKMEKIFKRCLAKLIYQMSRMLFDGQKKSCGKEQAIISPSGGLAITKESFSRNMGNNRKILRIANYWRLNFTRRKVGYGLNLEI